MRLLDSLERRFGRYAIRGLIGYIAFFQCLVFAVLYVNKPFLAKIVLVPFTEMDGEWWRVFTFLTVPDASSLLMFVFSIYIALMCGSRVEGDLGIFRMNLFVAVFVLSHWGMAALAGTAAGDTLEQLTGSVLVPNVAGYHYYVGNLLFTNVFLTFAVLEPRFTFLLFGIVPLTARVLALVDAGLILFNIMRTPQLWLVTLLSLAPFACFALPQLIKYMRHRATVGSRRTRFKANSLTVTDSFHRCHTCGRTDASDPELDFRITDDGIEYCSGHLPKP